MSRVASFTEDSGLELTLKNFLDYYHLDPRAIYKFSSFSRICSRADAIEDFSEPLEDILTKAFAKFTVIDSRRWISFLLDILPRLDNVDFATLSDVEKRMMQMFYITVWGKAVEDWNSEEVQDNLYALSDSTVLLNELMELQRYRFEQIDFIDEPVNLGFDCPLDLHCTYTRDQLLVAMDFMRPTTVREGVKWLPDKQLDVFFVTLNKADKDYSPTTMYNDYSISESLFHWQSQSTTAENSSAGQRYIHHTERGNKVLLFVREFKSDRVTGGAEAYTYHSYGNGSAMRVSSAAWLAENMEEALHLAQLTAKVTHDHPEGIKGAQATAAAIFLARTGHSKEEIKAYVERKFGYDLSSLCGELSGDCTAGYHWQHRRGILWRARRSEAEVPPAIDTRTGEYPAQVGESRVLIAYQNASGLKSASL